MIINIFYLRNFCSIENEEENKNQLIWSLSFWCTAHISFIIAIEVYINTGKTKIVNETIFNWKIFPVDF